MGNEWVQEEFSSPSEGVFSSLLVKQMFKFQSPYLCLHSQCQEWSGNLLRRPVAQSHLGENLTGFSGISPAPSQIEGQTDPSFPHPLLVRTLPGCSVLRGWRPPHPNIFAQWSSNLAHPTGTQGLRLGDCSSSFSDSQVF